MTLAVDRAPEQDICTGERPERPEESWPHPRSEVRSPGLRLSDARSRPGMHRPPHTPRDVPWYRSLRGRPRPGESRRSRWRLSTALIERKPLLLSRLRVPRNLHCQPAKRSRAVKSGPTGPSASEPRSGALDGRAERSYLGPKLAVHLEVSPTMIHGEPSIVRCAHCAVEADGACTLGRTGKFNVDRSSTDTSHWSSSPMTEAVVGISPRVVLNMVFSSGACRDA